ncbi:NADH-FMN oxidoreductase RutF, flavin reductase (DIM6/NTAB) family [Nonomuraea solani]|uniref:NADH-FMN oxidoreductase RutF, flavin reductase (DIM6/NTAB) family n=1 Tax=Nonomuraea solani TaxID=1144553 RepID=A0A1H6EY22_9ACTN|nr:flavin reductase family protein [Nonomuraea solani]SEH01845.1 NADH-FMN oxidoreductase RutF, flavin reductase (DIM6/NTAB) family [Nonomuraea solani]
MAGSHARPPMDLDRDLEIDPAEWSRPDTYDLVTALVVPRPIAWVSTVSPGGHRNLAPHSYFNLVADHPVHVAFSSVGVKDTLRNIRATGEFVVNIAGQPLLSALDATAADVEPECDEFMIAGVTPEPARCVQAPRVAEAPAHFECVLADEVPVGNCILIIGRVVHVHVAPSVWSRRRVDPAALDPTVRLSRRYGMLAPVFTPEESPSPHVLAE